MSMAKLIAEWGLGFRSLRTIMEVFKIKEAWAILTSNSSWATFMRNMYMRNQWARTVKLPSSTSKI